MTGMEAANREDLFAHRGRGTDRSQQIEPGAVLTLPNFPQDVEGLKRRDI